MRLADFIDACQGRILAEWEDFAATSLPSAARMDPLALRDHAPQILQAIAADLRLAQAHPPAVPSGPGHGLAAGAQGAPHTAAEVHGTLRAQGGFSMAQLVGEYRALRASVLRLWTQSDDAPDRASMVDDLMRFNAAIDQAVAESVDFFGREHDQGRTERDAALKAAAMNRARLAYASRLSRVGFWYCDLPFDVLEWDDQVKEHFFFGPEARITIDDFYARIHPEDREPTRLAIAASIGNRTPYDIVYRTQHPDAPQVKWIRALGGTDYADDGTPIHFDGVTVDVTAQKLEEQRVAESEARHRGVLENMDESFTLFDRHFDIVEVNDSACRLVGLPRSELLGANNWTRFPGTYDSELGALYRTVLADRKPRTLEHHFTFADGRECWLEARVFAVGEGVAVLFRDVTQRREMIEALRDADRRKDEFLAMLAHELRNPLAPITSAGEILARLAPPDTPVATATAIVRRQTRHLTRLVEDLLDVSRITQGRIQLQKAAVDVVAIVAQAVETCQVQLQAKHQHLTVTRAGSAPLYVEGDFARLVQCVGNILANAVKYTDAHGEIRVGVRAEGDAVVIEVADTGAGIGPELLPHIFDLFVQSERTLDRSQGGLGVGLAVVKRLVEMHGGQVRAASAGEGAGSTFEIRLPRLEAPAGARDVAEAVRAPARRVLVIDDNVDAAQSLVLLLGLQGHTAVAVHGAREALAAAGAFGPDLLLVDIGLPEIDGYALAATLRNRAEGARLRLVALTGYGQAEDRQRAREAGFDHHLVKPVDGTTLERVIAELTDAGGSAP